MGKAQEIRAFTQEIRDFTMQRYQRHGIDSKAGVLAFLKKPTIPYSCTTAAQSLSTIQPPQAQETCPSTAAKRKRFIPLPSPLTQKEKATAFSFCNQGGSLALPLLALARRRDTTARHFSTLAHHEAGENRCELSLAFKKIDSASAEYMDCRALPSDKARNDDENAQILNKPTKDSRVCENAQSSNTPPQARANLDSSKSPSDSKILDEKCGLQAKAQGSYLSGNDRRAFVQLPHFSLKAESPQAKIPTLLCRHSKVAYESALESPYIVHFAAQPKPWGRVCYIKQTHSTLELIEYASPHTKQWWEVARKSPFFTEILRAFIAPTLQAYKTKAIFAAKTKAPRIYAALHALARLFTPSNPSHKEA